MGEEWHREVARKERESEADFRLLEAKQRHLNDPSFPDKFVKELRKEVAGLEIRVALHKTRIQAAIDRAHQQFASISPTRRKAKERVAEIEVDIKKLKFFQEAMSLKLIFAVSEQTGPTLRALFKKTGGSPDHSQVDEEIRLLQAERTDLTKKFCLKGGMDLKEEEERDRKIKQEQK